MRNICIFGIVFVLIAVPEFSRAQAWDWVTDEKSMQAFSEQYLNPVSGQLGELAEYLLKTEMIKYQQQEIAKKVRYIHMVRDSLFKSLQDVRGISGSIDEQVINNVFEQVEEYYPKIYELSNKYKEFEQTWKQYDNYVVTQSKVLLKMADMAVGGSDEKNLLDKEQRLRLLSYVVYEMKALREMSKRTLHELVVGDAMMTNTEKVIDDAINQIYGK